MFCTVPSGQVIGRASGKEVLQRARRILREQLFLFYTQSLQKATWVLLKFHSSLKGKVGDISQWGMLAPESCGAGLPCHPH